MKSTLAILCIIVTSSGLTSVAEAQSGRDEEASQPLDEMIDGNQVWETTAEVFEQRFAKAGLQWLSASKDQARFFGDYTLWNKEVRVSEAIAEFQAGRLARVNLSIFNRGDSAEIAENKDAFEKQIEDIKTRVTTRLGVQPTERGKDNQSAVKAMGYLWLSPPTAYLLEYSYQREMKSRGVMFRPEFIRLRVAAIPKQQGLLAPASATGSQAVGKSTLSANLTRESNGDVVIKNVPMVDQGPKGYCAVATAERVFRYYGIAVDQHEMAQIANTGEGGGTSPDEMLKALEKLEARMRVRVRALQKWDVNDFITTINEYNREAKRNDKREIDINGMQVLDISEIYSRMDAPSLKDSRTVKDKSGYGKFQRSVADLVEKGIPLMWSVQLGVFKEDDIPQGGGGHMRLIIGYNSKTSEILYSDSWGAEHALKRMPMDTACAMTTGLYYMEPMK